jgi:Acetyltransferase (GNAT) domain
LTIEGAAVVLKTIEVSISGKWKKAPCVDFAGKTLVVMGNRVRVASVHEEDWLETELGDPENCVNELRRQRERGLRIDVVTFAQKIPNTTPQYSYPMELESIAAARTPSFKQWWESLPQETRKNVRRSQKRGVEIRQVEFGDEIVRAIMAINNESEIRQGRRFPHYGKSFDQVRKDYASFRERSDMFGAYYGTELIGVLKLVYRGEIASILQLLVKLTHQDKRPANALMTKAVELCAAGGITHLTYGRFSYGNKGHSSLIEFKTRHGFREVFVPRYYVPLTSLGALYTKLRLYRGLLGFLPASFIKVGLRARDRWYDLKNFSGRCSSRVEQPNSNRPMERSTPPAGSSNQVPMVSEK